jgi:recombination protein RecA
MKKKNAEQKSLKEILSAINSDIGTGIASMGDDKNEVEVIPTGILPLDFALGCGGIPRGRITDIFGMESAGKSTLCYILISQAQKMGIPCAIVDAENSYMPDYSQRYGVDASNLLVITPSCFEEAAESMEKLIRGGVGLIVIDSVSSLVPKSEAEAEHGKAPMAIQARLMSQMLRKLVTPIAKNNTAVVCINQMRANLMATNPHDKYTVTGGFALKFYSSIRMKVSRVGSIMGKSEKHIGYKVGFKVVKNKTANPGGNCEVPYMFDSGYIKEGDLVTMCVERDIFSKEGNSIIFEGNKIGRGHADATAYLDSNKELKQRVISLLFPQPQL